MQAALFPIDAGHQRAHLVRHEMVYLHRDPAAAGVINKSRGLFDRLQAGAVPIARTHWFTQ